MRDRISTIFLVLILCIAGGAVRAQGAVTQVADLNTGPNASATGSLGASSVFFDTRTIFVADTRESGGELWVTDGSAANTRQLADICPGRCSSSPSAFHVEGSNLFFAADDGRRGRELWRLAAGSAIPVLVADINPGARGSDPARFFRLSFVANNVVVARTFFAATRQAEGRELWRLNAGASPSVALELDVLPGPTSSEPRGLAVFNTLQVGLTATNAERTREVYALNYASSTAPASGATVLTGFATSPQHVVLTDLITLGSNTYVVLLDGNSFDRELWATQGTIASTVRLRTADDISNLTVNATLARLFFTSRNTSTTLLAISDGTIAGTTNLTASTLNPKNLASFGNQLLFTGVTTGTGRELFRSDGTMAGTVLLKELVSGTAGIPENATSVLTANGARMLLGFSDQLWISDATSPGTVEISGSTIQGTGSVFLILPTTATSAMIGFAPANSSGSEPFFTQGTNGSTVALGNLASDVGDSSPRPTGTLGSRLVFTAFIPGQTAGTFGMPFSGPGTPEALGNFGTKASGVHFGKLWFRGLNLVFTDGTSAGTTEIAGIRAEIRGPECVIDRLGFAYFLAHGTDFADVEVYRSDGTAANTVPITDFSDASVRNIQDFCGAGFHGIAAFADKLFFTADQNGLGIELYALNAADQASMVADIRAGSLSSNPLDIVALDDRIVFNADDGIFGNELWTSTGTAQGTQRLSDFSPGLGSSAPEELTRVGNLIYFTAFEPSSGHELYVTDGTTAGTRRVLDLFTGPGSGISGSTPRILAQSADKVFFRALSSTDPTCTLFESDGSPAGTRCAYDSASTSLGPVLEAVVTANGALVFTAARFSPDDGEEIRVLFNRRLFDVLDDDVAPGSAGSAPQSLLATGDTVFFRADDGMTGAELWRLDVPNLDALLRDGFE